MAETYFTTKTWADLDKANGKHYGRGKPALLLRAESLLAELQAESVKDFITKEEAYELPDQIERAEAIRDYLYARWQESFDRHWSDDPKHYGEIEF